MYDECDVCHERYHDEFIGEYLEIVEDVANDTVVMVCPTCRPRIQRLIAETERQAIGAALNDEEE